MSFLVSLITERPCHYAPQAIVKVEWPLRYHSATAMPSGAGQILSQHPRLWFFFENFNCLCLEFQIGFAVLYKGKSWKLPSWIQDGIRWIWILLLDDEKLVCSQFQDFGVVILDCWSSLKLIPSNQLIELIPYTYTPPTISNLKELK